MTRRTPTALSHAVLSSLGSLGIVLALLPATASAVNYPITPQQRSTAQQVAQAGVPLSELAPNAPDSYTVKRGDTLWDISSLFLKSPWRWPELWGMNLEQIRNPHLIYPGQVLYLEKIDGMARLRMGRGVGQPTNTVKLSPRVRASGLDEHGISSIPFHLIEPFLNEAVIFERNALETAPRIVAAQEGHVNLGRGDTAYVRGELAGDTAFRIFREPRALKDPTTGEVLGYEAVYVGTADFVRQAPAVTTADGKTQIVPASFVISSARQEANVADRLAPVPPREFSNYAPHAPSSPIAGQIASIYGDALTAGQNQIVALNKGTSDGIERGHVLALWRDGQLMRDRTDPSRPLMKLPNERHGMLFVFRVFERMSYALILNVQTPVSPGDRFTQP